MNKPVEPSTLENTVEDNEINEKIKDTNAKVISKSVKGTILIGIVALLFCPFSGFFPIIVWTGLISLMSFMLLYQLLFYYFGKELIVEAKKRGQCLVKESCFENNNPVKNYTTYPEIQNPCSKVLVDYNTHDTINIANGNPPGMGYIGPIKNRD